MGAVPGQVFRWRCGRYLAEMTLPTQWEPGKVSSCAVEWSPHAPGRADLSRDFMRQYRRGRDKAYMALANLTRGTIACVELGTSNLVVFEPGKPPRYERLDEQRGAN